MIRTLTVGMVLLALAGCNPIDLDFRNLGRGMDTTPAATAPTADRPPADARGIISYPGYQVAIARQGDTVSDIAVRVGVPAEELARFNGLQDGVPLRVGETLVLPEGRGTTVDVDVAAIAGTAIERAGEVGTSAIASAPPVGAEPVRHRVQPGETAFSISRLYAVTPRALAEWNGLDAEFNVRPGQVLLIPVSAEPSPGAPLATTTIAAAPVATPEPTTTPGQGTLAPEPPSAATPLPVEEPEPVRAEPPPQENLAAQRTDSSRFLMPAAGSIVRPYEKGSNDGIGIAAAAGSPVRAADDGVVAAITRDTDQVPILVLRHDSNVLTVYAGVDGVAVEKGDTVKRGDRIANIRATGQPFLHFEVREGFDSVDPMPYLN